MAQLMFKIANEPPTDIRGINPGIAPGLAAFLERAMAKNPDERFATGEEFGGALRAALAGAGAAPAAPAGAKAAAEGGVDIEL
jgi:serine/threonine-protein kinase